ncbi:MAG: competence/damage-inducible protein A [Chloroflexia bacterium]
MFTAEILAIGNELLLGEVLDTNSGFLCRYLTCRGGRVRRVVQVPDEPEAIAAEVRGALGRSPDLILTTGGLGPTDDDLTLQAVAQALGRPLVENVQALAMLERRYAELLAQGIIADATLTPPRRKMARLPEGGEPLFNPVGTAPAVLLHQGKTLLVCLPGVPEEVQGIVEGSLQEHLSRTLAMGHHACRSFRVNAGEATLSPLLQRLARKHSNVYIKSHAGRVRPDARLQVRVTLSSYGDTASEAEARVRQAAEELCRILAEAGLEGREEALLTPGPGPAAPG